MNTWHFSKKKKKTQFQLQCTCFPPDFVPLTNRQTSINRNLPRFCQWHFCPFSRLTCKSITQNIRLPTPPPSILSLQYSLISHSISAYFGFLNHSFLWTVTMFLSFYEPFPLISQKRNIFIIHFLIVFSIENQKL